jgi:hypothetical protein
MGGYLFAEHSPSFCVRSERMLVRVYGHPVQRIMHIFSRPGIFSAGAESNENC